MQIAAMPMLSKPVRAIHGACQQSDGVKWSSGQRVSDSGKTMRMIGMWGADCWESMEDDDDVTHCCLPSGCPRYDDDLISLTDPGDAIKVICNNEKCHEGQWMHADCFQDWEDHILSYLRSCGRARSWSEKQRHQNLWTKKGYDLAFKVCDCKCGKGHLRFDTNYTAATKSDEERRQKKMKRRDRLPSLVTTGSTTMGSVANGHDMRSPVRIHRSSFSSNGSASSPPSSLGTTPVTPPGIYMPRKDSNSSGNSSSFEFCVDPDQATSGNIFQHRTNLHVFYALPHRRQNTYQIKTEDEGPHGNDEIRCQVLTALSAIRATTVNCVCCLGAMTVYDKYPLIDGTFFLSPVCYPGTPEDLKVIDYKHRGGSLHLNAICMRCLEGKNATLICRACRIPWSGASLVIGTMYAYDIFAAVPCCAGRLSCKRCRQALCDPSSGFKFFSDYSRLFRCPCCATEDYHFVKPLDDTFTKILRHV
jgi:headcase protein